MVKYRISGRPLTLQLYNRKEHCGMTCTTVVRTNLRVFMDRVHRRNSKCTVLIPTMSVRCSIHHLRLWCPNVSYLCTLLLSVRFFIFCGRNKFLVNFRSHLYIVRCACPYQKAVSFLQYLPFVLSCAFANRIAIINHVTSVLSH